MKYESVAFGHLIEEYMWHDERRDKVGSYIKKDSDNAWLLNPVVLYAKDDLYMEVTRPAWEGELKAQEHLKRTDSACALIKDPEISGRLRAEGGVCTTLDDSDVGFVALFWFGKTMEEVEAVIFGEEKGFNIATAKETLRQGIYDLVGILGVDKTRAAFEETLAKVIVAKSEDEESDDE